VSDTHSQAKANTHGERHTPAGRGNPVTICVRWTHTHTHGSDQALGYRARSASKILHLENNIDKHTHTHSSHLLKLMFPEVLFCSSCGRLNSSGGLLLLSQWSLWSHVCVCVWPAGQAVSDAAGRLSPLRLLQTLSALVLRGFPDQSSRAWSH